MKDKSVILVVDDQPKNTELLEAHLVPQGYEVVIAASGEEALKILSGSQIDLVLLDVMMPRMSGFEVLEKIRADKKTRLIPVVMVTVLKETGDRIKALEAGCDDFISKPFDRHELLVRVKSLLRIKSLHDEVEKSLLHATRTALKYKALNEEKEKYRTNLDAIFRSVRDAIITVDKESVVLALNDAAISLCGYSFDDIGKPFGSLPKICNGQCERILSEAIETGKPVEVDRIEYKIDKHDTRVISIRTYPLIDLQGLLSGSVMVLRDDTHVVNLERALTEHRCFQRIIGKSQPMQKVYSLIKALANVQTTVLITGESGTGKELVAEALHLAGERSHKPLVKVNCSALSENLLESELFGHVKGAFTGAIRDNMGRFHKADSGTIFLDEIGDISAIIQLKLLRVIEEREFERVGSSTTIGVDVRLIAATNNNLKEKVRLGELREDLYYRLKVVEICLPPLRERPEDIPLLVEHFRSGFNLKFNKTIEAISADVMKAFLAYHWPGNIRELEHAMEHAFILCSQNIITLDHLPPDVMASQQKDPCTPVLTQEADILNIREALGKTDWNKAKAARLLGIDRVTLYRKIARYSITKESAL